MIFLINVCLEHYVQLLNHEFLDYQFHLGFSLFDWDRKVPYSFESRYTSHLVAQARLFLNWSLECPHAFTQYTLIQHMYAQRCSDTRFIQITKRSAGYFQMSLSLCHCWKAFVNQYLLLRRSENYISQALYWFHESYRIL